MTGDQLGSLGYLLLLGVFIAGWYFVSNRQNLGRMAQHATIWLFLFLGGIVAVGLWMDIRDDIIPRQSSFLDGSRIEVPRAMDGHYYLTLDINGELVRFVVDTGASEIVLSTEAAARVGIDVDTLFFSGRALTANGMVQTAPIRLDKVELGGIVDENVRAVVNGGDFPQSLLGMSYLAQFDRLEITEGRLILER